MKITGTRVVFLSMILVTLVALQGAGTLLDGGHQVLAESSVEETENSESAGDLDVIIIDNQGYSKNRKGSVTFTHRKHAKDYRIVCWECHHEYEDGENIWAPWDSTEKCNGCHDPVEAQDDIMRLQTAFHINCKNCHKAMAKKGEKTGPYRKCLQCHKKSSK